MKLFTMTVEVVTDDNGNDDGLVGCLLENMRTILSEYSWDVTDIVCDSLTPKEVVKVLKQHRTHPSYLGLTTKGTVRIRPL